MHRVDENSNIHSCCVLRERTLKNTREKRTAGRGSHLNEPLVETTNYVKKK